MINRINSTQSPAFGMAFRFKEDGAKRMAEAFKNVPNEARNLIKKQASNKDVDIVISNNIIDIEPKIYRNKLEGFITYLRENLFSSNMQKSLLNPDVKTYVMFPKDDLYTDPKLLTLREEIKDNTIIADKVQKEINKIKDQNMSISDFAKELENLAYQ